jgi:AcrR family transcriptional regulator
LPKVTEAHLEARRRQILGAAASCFARKGFHQAKMQDICDEAGLSPGAVYRYFAGKEDIIAAMVDERRREGIALIDAIKRERHDTLEVLDEIAEVFFSRLEDLQGCKVDIELWAESQNNSRVKELFKKDILDIHEAFALIIEHAQEHGEINPHLDPKAVAQVMNSLFHGLIWQRSLDPAIEIGPYVQAIKAMMGGNFWTKGA